MEEGDRQEESGKLKNKKIMEEQEAVTEEEEDGGRYKSKEKM